MLEGLGKLKPCPQRAGTAASGGLPILCLFGMGAARVRLALGAESPKCSMLVLGFSVEIWLLPPLG